MEQSMDHRDPADAAPDADNNLGRGAPHDREERIQQKRREDAELHREGANQERPGIRLSKEGAKRTEGQGRRAKSKARRATRGE
jgi:hypothetical protein